MSIQAEISGLFTAAAGGAPIALAEPKNLRYGDYATNIALRLAKLQKKAPPRIAQELAAQLNAKTPDFVFTEINGFINIKINDRRLFQELDQITPDYGRPDYSAAPDIRQSKILLEYVSANPTGPLHIGHGRWAVIGDILARALAYCGYAVTKEFYINDAGRQIANFLNSVNAVKNRQPLPEDGYHGSYINELARLDADPVQVTLDQQKETLKNIRSEFDSWFSEKTLHQSGALEQVLNELKKQNAVYTKDGALLFKSTAYGDDKDRVLIKSGGEKTYFTADIAYHRNKLDRGFTKLLNIWGADHHGYIPRVQAALQALTGKSDTRLTVILGQLVNLYRGGEPVKMSKRTGELITLKEVAEEIGVDALRYFLAMRSPDTALDFDLDLAKKQSSDNPVYYVQYAHARICSILRQNIPSLPEAKFLRLEPAERLLLLKIIRLPSELETISQTYGIHRLCSYAQELAALFHNFYHECKVIAENMQVTAYRLKIIRAVQTVLKIILDLLAVSAPEKM
ncbi:MAG: arginine--tRNA ligase [Candidatus Margulisbacteria bacterium]|jgi:arginyl-tRNA synthetase|nr:arginine--tRNA ligase [Candidatus Margulisiibacteriota bacterium]